MSWTSGMVFFRNVGRGIVRQKWRVTLAVLGFCLFFVFSALGLEVVDDAGRVVRLAVPASRVVSLTPANTEIVFALEAGEKLVGVTTYCDYPKEAKDKEKVGSLTEVDLEAVVRLAPDLVLAGSLTPKETIDRLAGLGYPVVVLDAKSLSEVLEGIRKVALLLGKENEGEKLVASLERTIRDISTKVAGIPEDARPLVFHVIWHDPLWTAGKNTFIHEFITLAGGRNVAGDLEGYVTFDLEELVRRNPDIITVVSSHGEENSPYQFVLSDPRLRTLKAVQRKKVFVVDSDIVSRPGPRVVEALRVFASLIHPELFPQEAATMHTPPSE
ncbi:MAG: ABC transporter substrate-binding protein [Candidatus Caldatribacterium sp.]|uniref:ABC transporter substrate-binding protein n=1 Tax=Candidatus Caldatribacterium sp. TaxID=2282143 RepID=UPI0029940621|nr:ABC transporter substrate-binding protein [Candidatus Caldatribacterium sp.]MCX7730602.1 ABC transporter substrate-binding protein [Candidatus Caldatribacterium sp.]MDW8081868.1 ABC transporter substrate-binding protein [Candidatus Calescibacterium sp.]